MKLEKKIYHIYPEYAEEILLHISNHDEQGLKRVSRAWINQKDCHLDGNGATLVFHGDIIPFYLKNCEKVLLENFTICYAEQIYTQAVVRKTGSRYMEIEIDAEHNPWEIRNGRCCFLCDGKWQELSEWLEWDTEKKAPAAGIRDVYLKNETQDGIEVTFTALSENLLGVEMKGDDVFPEGSKAGNTLVMRHHLRTHPAIYVCDSKNVTLRNISITDSRGMGFLAERTENILLDQVRVQPPENSERIYSITADATHFVYCSGKIEIRNCLFENQMDDAVNIHGIYLRIREVLGDSSVIVQWVHPMQKGVLFGKAGDIVGIVDHTTMLTTDQCRIETIEVYNRDFAKITLDHMPEEIGKGDALENLTYIPDVEIVGCAIRSNRARGILVTSGGHVVLRSNLFQNAGAAILIEGDANYWFESGATKDLIVEQNTFRECCYVKAWGQAVIQVSPGVMKSAGEQRYHRRLTIRENRFVRNAGQLLKTDGIREIYFKDNHVEWQREKKTDIVIDKWAQRYEHDKEIPFAPILEELKNAAKGENEQEYEVYLRFLQSLVPYLYQHYELHHFPQHVAVNTMEDLKWKTRECEKLYGVKGIFVPDWFEGFFQMKRFTLGRLQFERWQTPKDYPLPETERREEVPYVINVHIPEAGPLDYMECKAAYREAAAFFKKYFGMEKIFFYCDSWLLTPAHEEILPEQSNVLQFMRDYQIYHWEADEKGHDLWRIFGKEDCSNAAELPENTSLQKAYKKWLLDGNYSGCGKGAML
ncbi:MAG: acyltransferase domain-containing protein [Hespellia sp.]|nr:acyltransferase domain-containing protein [Hespellia sp.]